MARPTTKSVDNLWTWVDYLEVLSDGATEYRWQGTARARDMDAAEKKLIVVLEEEHAERDVHPSTRLDALIQAGVLSRALTSSIQPTGLRGPSGASPRRSVPASQWW
ncbi:hypothetical protein [Kineococcus aurantiacus]|uniref:hypothetical protein n=1 Tax=Kineococcus aurantiacus TaxID=37633 RepID=UPI0031DC72B7